MADNSCCYYYSIILRKNQQQIQKEGDNLAGNFEGIKTRNFGIEIEMTGLTRCQAAKAITKVLGGTAFHEGGSYDKCTVDQERL